MIHQLIGTEFDTRVQSKLDLHEFCCSDSPKLELRHEPIAPLLELKYSFLLAIAYLSSARTISL